MLNLRHCAGMRAGAERRQPSSRPSPTTTRSASDAQGVLAAIMGVMAKTPPKFPHVLHQAWLWGSLALVVASVIWVGRGTVLSDDAGTRATLAGWILGAASVVSSVLAYLSDRSQRQETRLGRESARGPSGASSKAYSKAAANLGSPDFFVRLASIHALAELADTSEEFRQDCISSICLSLQRYIGDRDLSLEIQKVIRSRLSGDAGSPAWKACRFVFSDSSIYGLDLQGLELLRGSIEFSGVCFSGDGVNLSKLALRNGAVMSIKGAEIRADVRLDDLQCLDSSRVVLSDLRVSGAELSLGRATIGDGEECRLSKVFIAARGLVSLQDARVTGTVHAGDILLTGDRAALSLANMRISRGVVRFDRINQKENSFLILSGMRLDASGALVINELNCDDSTVRMRGVFLHKKSTLVSHEMRMSGQSTVDLSGSRTHEGSHLLVATSLSGDSEFRAHAVENNDDESVLVMRAESTSATSLFDIAAGGNYQGDAHIIMQKFRAYPVGKFSLSDFYDLGGSLEISIAHEAEVEVEPALHSSGALRLAVSGPPPLLEAYSRAAGPGVRVGSPGHQWFEHLRDRFPFQGSQWEWSWDEIENLISVTRGNDGHESLS